MEFAFTKDQNSDQKTPLVVALAVKHTSLQMAG